MTDKKCPKCGSRCFQIVDYFVTGYIYEVEDGIVTGEGADEGGEHIRTTCCCRGCGHLWHPRNFNYTIDN